jgi:uncharacterized protein (DUF488 family)
MLNQNNYHGESISMPVTRKILTIGVYGYNEETFFQTLKNEGVDTFCDIRRRRGVRGAGYAFANSKRLRDRLLKIGIQYHHILELAPTAKIRERQKLADKTAKITKTKRIGLDNSFVEAYTEEILNSFDTDSFLETLGEQARVIVLFCVEKEPAACHRSLVAKKLQQELGFEIDHKVP